MRRSSALCCLLVLGCVPAPAPPPQEALSPSAVPSPSPSPLSGPDPANLLVFPTPQPASEIRPKVACIGTEMSLAVTRLPPGAAIEVWLKDFTMGGWKTYNPPRPQWYGARRLGSAVADATGTMTFAFTFTKELAAMRGPTEGFEVWLVYPEVNGQTPIRPTAATFALCEDGAGTLRP